MRGYPKGFLKFLLVIMTITFISGMLILPQALDLKFAILIPNPVSEKYSIFASFIHGITSIIFIFIIGSLWTYHMRQGWRKKENIISGLGLCFCFAILFLSAMGLYYLSTDASLAVASIIHISIGIVVAIVFAIHYLHFIRKSKLVKTI